MDSWVIVQTFINPQEAYMAKAFLESAGIETRMQDESSGMNVGRKL